MPLKYDSINGGLDLENTTTPPPPQKNMILRIITASILLGIAYAIWLWAPWGLVFYTEVLLLLAVLEWTMLGKMDEVRQGITLLLFIVISLPMVGVIFQHFFFSREITHAFILSMMALGALYWLVLAPYLLKKKFKVANGWAGVLIGGSTTAIAGASAAFLIYRSPTLLMAAIALPIIVDTFAYLGGKLIGKTPLSPISPKKTKEGVVVGMIAVIGIGGMVLYHFMGLSWWSAGIVATLSGCAAVIGDLHESLAKRWAQVKDSSQLLPGHGGVLDRFDSHIAVLPIVALSTIIF
jgi:phosphatidate cytidylyltransferase